MGNLISVTLPWPPTINTYWRRNRGRYFISKKGMQYRLMVLHEIHTQRQAMQYNQRIKVWIEAFPPDRRKRDLDNILKALFDSLTEAGVWMDDEQIDEIHVLRREVEKPGKLIVEISPILED